jgi:general secretion pathway protein K
LRFECVFKPTRSRILCILWFRLGKESRVNRPFSNNNGVALVLVLWILAFLSVLVGEFCLAMRTEINITANFKEETLSYYYAKAGVNLATHRLLHGGVFLESIESDEEPWNEGAVEWHLGLRIPPISFGEGSIEIEIENESGKININYANAELLRIMLNPFGLDDEDKNVIVDSILDWRDADDLYRLNGAEDEYYGSLVHPYDARNGDFDSVEELLLVRGVTPEIFYGGLKEMVTIYPGESLSADNKVRKPPVNADQININAAPPQVLQALPQMTDDLVQAILEYREEQPFLSIAQVAPIVGSDVYGAIAPYLSTDLVSHYTIRSTGMVTGSPARRGIEVVIEIDKTATQKCRVVEWLDNVAFVPDSPEGQIDFSG